jgi:hypothetical protein
LWNSFDLARARQEKTVAFEARSTAEERVSRGLGASSRGRHARKRQSGFCGEAGGGGEYIGVGGHDHIGVGRPAFAVVRRFVVGGVDRRRRPLAP